MSSLYDVIVVGLGGMGSATVYQLAQRGYRVLGLERHTKAHDQGSSHGQSRVIRLAYFEDPAYVPLLVRSYELWEQIERETDQSLLVLTGGLMMGPADSHVVAGSIRSAQEWGLDHEVLDAADIRRRFSPFNPGPDVMALYETKAGFVRPEASVAAHLERAAQLGAEIHYEEPVLSWEASASGEGVTVRTAKGVYQAGHLSISPGAWAPHLLADMNLPLEVERAIMYWFDPIGGVAPYEVGRFPIYIWETAPGVQFYGFPGHDGPEGGVKVAFFRWPTGRQICTADTIDRTVHPHEVEMMRQNLAGRMPTLNGRFMVAKTCLYTNTPDEHFVITTHPVYRQVAVAAGFSGHGYKFASVVGEIMADLATTGHTRHPIDLFKSGRFLEKKP